MVPAEWERSILSCSLTRGPWGVSFVGSASLGLRLPCLPISSPYQVPPHIHQHLFVAGKTCEARTAWDKCDWRLNVLVALLPFGWCREGLALHSQMTVPKFAQPSKCSFKNTLCGSTGWQLERNLAMTNICKRRFMCLYVLVSFILYIFTVFYSQQIVRSIWPGADHRGWQCPVKVDDFGASIPPSNSQPAIAVSYLNIM